MCFDILRLLNLVWFD